MEMEMEQLIAILKEIIHNERDTSVINPVWAADEAYKKIDPENKAPFLVRIAAIIQLRQLARPLLRKQFDPTKSEIEQPPSLFPELQWRYPKVGTKEGYVLLMDMTKADIRYNVARMRKTCRSISSHADRLEAFGEMYIHEDAEEVC
jgi:hypothetical protein